VAQRDVGGGAWTADVCGCGLVAFAVAESVGVNFGWVEVLRVKCGGWT
jgi:hypothetical protein